jgi:hypothetical protein
MTDHRARAMTEDQLMESIRDLCALLRLRAFHVYDARRCWSPGYPDLTICGPGGLLFRECKTEHGTIRPEQTGWIHALKAARQNAGIWRPRDWFSGRIEQELRLLAGQPELPFAA